MTIDAFLIGLGGMDRIDLTFSADDRPDLRSSAWHTGFSYSSQGNAIPFILLNADIAADFNIESMERIHLYMDILCRDPS